MPEEHSIGYTDHIVFIHSPADGHLGDFHLLAIMNKEPYERVCASFCLNTCFQFS